MKGSLRRSFAALLVAFGIAGLVPAGASAAGLPLCVTSTAGDACLNSNRSVMANLGVSLEGHEASMNAGASPASVCGSRACASRGVGHWTTVSVDGASVTSAGEHVLCGVCYEHFGGINPIPGPVPGGFLVGFCYSPAQIVANPQNAVWLC